MIKPTTILFFVFMALNSNAQRVYPVYDSLATEGRIEELGLYKQAQRYLNSKYKKLTKQAHREEKATAKLLRKLSRKENKLLSRLSTEDSLRFAQTKSLPYDSLAKQMDQYKLGKAAIQTKQTSQKVVDSLKKIQQFAQQKLNQVNGLAQKTGMSGIETTKLDALGQKIHVNEQMQQLLQERTQSLSGLGKQSQYTGALQGIGKQAYYYKQKLTSYQQLAEEPSRLEEKALGYLKGMKGFDEAMAKPSLGREGTSDMQKASSAEDLERMGYQTKRQVKAQMTQQLGLKKPEQVEKLNTKFKDAQKQLSETKQNVQESKNAIKQLGFKPNPMRGLPLRQRVEKSLNWQVLRAVQGQPAKLELNAQAGFKHTASLTYSIVLGGSLGLGKDWQHIRLSHEGLRLGMNADLNMIWGISGQAGYERVYKTYTKTVVEQSEQQTAPQVIQETKHYRDIAYAGLQKTYKLNSKYNGTMLLAYDFLWRQGNASTPIIWRMGWKKK